MIGTVASIAQYQSDAQPLKKAKGNDPNNGKQEALHSRNVVLFAAI